MASIYRHDYNALSIYGNVVALLREHGAQGGVHLDIGCGYGAIAEPVRDELGLSYIGFDLADDGLESLRDRGFETHRIDLSDLDGFATIVRKAIANRPIASLTFIDTLEHITNGQEVLAALRQIAEPTGAPLVLSVPNVTHKDLALKLLLGRWDVTEDGLLDHTHVTLYSHERLARLMQTVGWRKAATRDWSLYQSDQYFPLSTPLLNRYLPVGQFLHELINRANPHALVNQFVRLYHVDEPRPRPLLVERGEPTGPFLSVLIDSAKDGLDRLKTLARGLEMQSSGDFEVVILHPPSVSTEELSDGPLAGLPSVGARARFVPNPGGSRAAALNAAVERSSGRYFAVLDDAGRKAPRWVSLIELSERLPGSVLGSTADLNSIAPGLMRIGAAAEFY
jgi:2-polyprenyl-3-methyl-5-hydroxy-6-metoxy-1,4-benzoquinol methylase